MRPIGFSTGALTKDDFSRAIRDTRAVQATAIELSALRWHELERLESEFEDLGLSEFSFVSVHLPSKFPSDAEARVVRAAKRFIAEGAVVVAHPDSITCAERWTELGGALCVENMDKRKPNGRTAAELERVFDRLEDASLCFDVGHVRQVDPSLTEAREIVRRWGTRIRMLHVSDVASSSVHEPLSASGSADLTWISSLLPAEVPAIIESPVRADRTAHELGVVTAALEAGARLASERSAAIIAA